MALSIRNNVFFGEISRKYPKTDIPRQTIDCGYTSMSLGGLESNIKNFIYYEFSSHNYNLEAMNCNTFSRFLIQYLDPCTKEAGLDKLSEIIIETAETFNRVEKGVKDAKDQLGFGNFVFSCNYQVFMLVLRIEIEKLLHLDLIIACFY